MARTEVTGLQIKDGSVSLTADVTGILPVANGGTGSNTLALNNVLLGNGTGALQAVAPGTAGNVLTSNGTSWVSSPNAGGGGDVTLTDTQTLTNKTIQLPRPDSIYSTDGSLVNTFYIGNSDSGRFPYFSPVPKYLWHDILRFSRFTGAPTYETYNGTAWSSQTLDTNILSGKEATAYALTNGTTTTGARWTWTSGNLSYSYLRWWVIGLGYVGATVPINSFLVESSADGTTWTTRHTSTVTSQAAPIWLYASDHGGHNRLRLTIITTNAQAINLSGIKGLSSRWANQGGGVEYEFPYDWDGSRNITTLANLTVGTPGTSAGSAATIDATQTLTNKTLTTPTITTPTVKDATGANFLTFSPATTPVNHLMVGNREAGNAPYISAVGNDTNIDLSLVPKGTGRVRIQNGLQSGGAGGTLSLPTTADTLVGRATIDTLTNKTISGASNTVTNLPASATPDAARMVNTLIGVSNQWAKVASFSPGSNAYYQCSLTLGVSCYGSNSNSIVSLHMGNQGSGTAPVATLSILAKGSGTAIADDGFKIVCDAYGSPIELWVKTQTNGGQVVFYELSRFINFGSLSYTVNPTFQATEPVGLVTNATSSGVSAGGVPVVTTTGTATLTNKTLTNPQINFIRSTNDANAMLISAPAGAVNYVGAYGNTAGSPVYLAAAGADANIPLYLSAKGTSAVNIGNTGGSSTVQVIGAASTANSFQIFGAAAGTAPAIAAVGSDTNVSLSLTSKGTGTVNANGVPVVTTTGTQTLTNKTLTSPAITGGATFSGGMNTFYNTGVANDDWQTSPISIRERGLVGTGQSGNEYAPNLNFHWASKNSLSLWMAANGSLNWGNYGAGTPSADGNINAAGFYGTFNGNLTGNAATATTLATARTINGVSFDGSANITVTDSTKQATSEKGQANGYASLDSGGKVPVAQLPNSIMEYQGVWNASTNTPTLANGTGSPGDVYRVSVAGTALSLTFDVGDYVIYNGSTWEKSDTTDAVATVNGYTGNITLTKSDVGLGNVDNTSNATERDATATLTNKTIALGSNTVSGTLAQFNTAVTDADLARTDAANTFTGVQTMTSPALTTPVITGTPTGTGVNTAATASTLALRDSTGNLYADNFISSVQSTVTAAGTTTLLQASAQIQVFTGTTTQTVLLPTNSVLAGQTFRIINQSTGSVAVQSSAAALIATVPAGFHGDYTALVSTPTTAAHWRGLVYTTTGQIVSANNSLAAFATSTTNTIGVGNIELGHASDTTLSRSAAGTLAVEGVNVVMTGGALGTPSSGTLTNCTFPTLNQNTTGSAATLTTARTIGGVSFNGSANIDLPGVNTAGTQNTSGTAANVTGTVAVANGGTGATTLAANNVLLGNGTSALQTVAPGTTGNVLTSNGTTWTSAAPTGGVSRVTSTVTSATTLGAVANTEYLTYIASGGSVTLPTAVGNTSLYTLKNTDTTTKTITTVGDDASFASVTALLLGNGDDASTVITDSSGKYSWFSDAGARLSTAVKKFGTASIYFGAGSGNSRIKSVSDLFPGVGSGDFTIEMWFYSTVAAPANGIYLYDTRPYLTNGAYTTLYVNSGQKLAFTVSAAERITGTTNITANTWHHAAVSRSGGVTKLFLNGVQEGSNYTDTTNYLTGAVCIGNTGAILNGAWAGYIDDVRVTQGVGRYTANFTAPTAEFPVPQLIDGTYLPVLAPNQAIELASSGSNWSVVSDAAALPALTTTPTSASTTILTYASTPIQEFTGTTTHTVRLPSTGIVPGEQYTILNNSTGLLTMQTSTGAQIHVLAPGTESILTALVATPTTAAHWEDSFIATSFAAGKSLTVNNSLTLAGTDATTMTFPGASDTVVTLAAAQTLTSKTLTTPTLTTPVINSTPTGTGVATAATASTLALRDANANITADNFINTVDSTATAAGITTLTIVSGGTQVFTGSTTQSVLLPTTSVVAGMTWTIVNNSTGAVLVASSAGNTVATVSPSTAVVCTAQVAAPTTAAHWTAAATSDATRRIVPRSISTASTATPSINSDTTDFYYLTALAVAITAITITGTPVDGQQLTLRFKDNGTARAIAWSSAFTSSGVAVLPTTTVANKTHLIGLMYDTQAAKWVCVASDSTGY